MASYLKVDLDALRDAIKQYTDAIDALRSSIRDVEKAIADLRVTKWNSDASVAYFEMYSDRWRKSVEDHLTALTVLRDSLNSAEQDYRALDTDMKALTQVLYN